jgi:hypothetical protein
VTDTSGVGDGAIVTTNKVFGTRIFDGIDVCTNNNTIQTNTIMNSSESAIHLDASCGVFDSGTSGSGNTVTGNTIVDACTGVLEDAGTSNTTVPNTYFAAGTTAGSSCTPTPSRQSGAGSKAGSARSLLNKSAHSPIRP